MTSERWALVQEIFAGALAQPAGSRAAWVAGRCRDDAALETLVLQLVDAPKPRMTATWAVRSPARSAACRRR